MAERATRRAIMYFIMERKYKRYAELGIAQGKTLRSILNWKPAISLLKEYYAIDIWEDYHGHPKEEWEQYYYEISGFVKKFPQLKVMRERTTEAAKSIPDGYLDIVFVDADHSYKAVKADIIAWLPKIRLGGILMGHDYNYGSVQKAVNEVLDNIVSPSAKKCWVFEVSINYLCKIKNDKLREKMINMYGNA